MERFETKVGETKLVLVQGDITKQEVEAIVNAANPDLTPGGGVSGAIHRAGGPKVTEEAAKIRRERGPLPTGEAVLTTGGNLLARYVIHTVGPIWRGGNQGEPELLAKAYHSSLRVALEHGIQTIAFPSISTGAYGYPVEKASRIAIQAVRDFLLANPGKLSEVRFVLFSAADFAAYRAAVKDVLGV